jgi:hypothetical protein
MPPLATAATTPVGVHVEHVQAERADPDKDRESADDAAK